MKKNLFTLSIAICALLAVGLACGKSATDAKPVGPEFVGAWRANDGSTITIRSDSTADYKIGSSSVSGGKAEVSEKDKTLKIGLLGMGTPMKLDKPPTNGEMTVDGVVYKNSGGGSTSSTSSSDVKPEIPNEDKLQTLVKTTFLDFNDGVQGEDFTDFHKKIAKVWRDSSTPEKLGEAFKSFTEDKENFNFKRAVSPIDAVFTPDPAIEKVADLDALVVQGYYPTKPARANFELKYVMDDGTWKLIAINVNTTKAD